jgi:hypothetical protein
MQELDATITPTPVAGILTQTHIAALLLPRRPSPWEDIQKTKANLQSQVDLHTSLTHHDNEERQPSASTYYLRDTGPPVDTASSDEDAITTHCAFCARVVPESADSGTRTNN